MPKESDELCNWSHPSPTLTQMKFRLQFLLTALFRGIDDAQERLIVHNLRKKLSNEDTSTDFGTYAIYHSIILIATSTGLPCLDCASCDGAPNVEGKSSSHLTTCRSSNEYETLDECPICFQGPKSKEHTSHSLLQMALIGKFKFFVTEMTGTMSTQTFKDCIQHISATYNQDKNVFKRQDLGKITLAQTYTLVYKALVGGTTKANLTRVNDYDKFKCFYDSNENFRTSLHNKLSECYKKGMSPNLDAEIALLNEAPLNTLLSAQVLGDQEEETKDDMASLTGRIVSEMGKGENLLTAHDCDDETLDLRSAGVLRTKTVKILKHEAAMKQENLRLRNETAANTANKKDKRRKRRKKKNPPPPGSTKTES